MKGEDLKCLHRAIATHACLLHLCVWYVVVPTRVDDPQASHLSLQFFPTSRKHLNHFKRR